MPDSPRECLPTAQKKNNLSALAEKFRVANLAFREARKNDTQRFSSSRDVLAALTEKRRNAPVREAFPDDAPLPQYDPSDEAGFDAGTGSFDGGDAPSIPFAEALERIPAEIRTFVRERFHAEFSNLRSSRKLFSYRSFGEERTETDEEALSDDTDDV